MKSIKFLLCLILVGAAMTSHAQTSTFTYQGRLTDSTAPANGTYEMQFSLWTAPVGGSQLGTTITNNSVTVTGGVFTVNLDFTIGPLSTGADRYLEIAVRKPTDPPVFTTLAPRHQITSSPYSVRTLSAATSDSLSANCSGCVNDAKISDVSGSKVTGPVASATTATTVSGIVPIANGGTGSATKNFVDLSTAQAVSGVKTFTNLNWGATPPAGLLGQSHSTVLSTGALNPVAAFGIIPGLTTTINVPSVCASAPTQCFVYISADGGVQTQSATTTGVSRVDITLHIDGLIPAAGAYKRVIAQNTGGSTTTIENWALGYATPLSVGNHTISVVAGLQSGTAAVVGGDSTSVLQGRLTVIVVRM